MENKKKYVIFAIIGIIILAGIIGLVLLSGNGSNNNNGEDPNDPGTETPVVEKKTVPVTEYTVAAQGKTEFVRNVATASNTDIAIEITVYSFGTVVNNEAIMNTVPYSFTPGEDLSQKMGDFTSFKEAEAYVINYKFTTTSEYFGTRLGSQTQIDSRLKYADTYGIAGSDRYWSTTKYPSGGTMPGWITVFVDKSSPFGKGELVQFTFYVSNVGTNDSLNPNNGYVKDTGAFKINYDNGNISIVAPTGNDAMRVK